MDKATRTRLVQQYKDGVKEVDRALEGATDAELDAKPAPGKWSAREIVHHLADSEMTSAIRLRRLLAEDKPQIVAYDQEEYARRLHYHRPIAASLRAFAAARETTGELLDGLSEAEWAREGTHTETGHYSVVIWLDIYAKHAHEHADQIRRARQAAAVRT
jgi:hypothetical protein